MPGGDLGDSPEPTSEGSPSQESSAGSEPGETSDAPAATGETPWQEWGGDGPPSYAKPPDLGAYQQQAPPWMQPQAPPPVAGQEPVDYRLTNADYVQAVQQGIHARYDGQFRAATSQAEQAAIQRAYAADVRDLQVRAREAHLAQREWHTQQQQQAMQAQLLPMLRQQAAETLARELRLDVNEVLHDRHGNPIWDANVMQLLARERSYQKYGQRVQQRQASGADRGYAASGGSDSGGDIAAMNEKQWNAYKERVRRTGGRALYDRTG